MINYIMFIVGFFLLIKGADYLVKGSSSLAKTLRISPLIIGLTVVAFGTSLPELFINIIAAVKGTTDIAIGNIIGSNIANILLVLGIAAIIFSLRVEYSTVTKEIPFSLLAALVLLISATDGFIGNGISYLTRTEGLIYICFFIIFIYYIYLIAKQQRKDIGKEHLKIKKQNHLLNTVMILGGIIGLYIGGKWVVDGAIFIAKNFGLSEFMISATIIALGTSLPELVTSLVAAFKKSADIAIGNIIGSNIFNVFWVLGITSLIRPIPLIPYFSIDLIFLLFITILLLAFIYIDKKYKIVKWEGIVLVILYIAYILFNIYRG